MGELFSPEEPPTTLRKAIRQPTLCGYEGAQARDMRLKHSKWDGTELPMFVPSNTAVQDDMSLPPAQWFAA